MSDWIEMIGFAGTGLTLAAWGMRDATHLRVAGMASSVAFLAYGLLTESWPVVATEAVLLPLNGFRLWQLRAERRTVLRAETEAAAEARARTAAPGPRLVAKIRLAA